MRIRLPVGRTLFLLLAFLFALLALLPLRLALDGMGIADKGLSARAATGSLWLGALQEAQVGPVSLGDVGARLNLLPLFLGRARLSLESQAPDGIEGAIVATRHGFALDSVSGSVRGGALFSPLPVATLELDDLGVSFAGGRCVDAGGSVRAVVAGELSAVVPSLAGNARCDGNALLLPLAGRSGLERIDMRVFADGRYRLDLQVRPSDPALGARLAAAGLRPVGGGYGLRVEGAF